MDLLENSLINSYFLNLDYLSKTYGLNYFLQYSLLILIYEIQMQFYFLFFIKDNF